MQREPEFSHAQRSIHLHARLSVQGGVAADAARDRLSVQGEGWPLTQLGTGRQPATDSRHRESRQDGLGEGPALLQGLVLCGRCGGRMTIRYHRRRGQLVPDYLCYVRTLQHRDPPCQVIPGGEVDATMGRLLLETVTPMTLELSLAVRAELEVRGEETDRLRRQQLERAQYEDHGRTSSTCAQSRAARLRAAHSCVVHLRAECSVETFGIAHRAATVP
ncbi:zinc ribbon domain-containing protein [Myxococcota bacterium]